MSNHVYKKVAIGWFFALEGCLVGSFNACSAIFKDANFLDEKTYGFILFVCVLAGIASVPFAARSCDMIGSAKTTLLSGAACVLVTPVMALVSGSRKFILLLIMVALFGFALAILDVGVNAQACVFEKLTAASHMGFMHAAYAVGAVLGSIWAGFLIHRQISFFNILVIIALVSGLASLPFLCSLMMKEEEDRLNATASTKGGVDEASDKNGSAEYAKLSEAATNMLRSPFTEVIVSSTSKSPKKNRRDVPMQTMCSPSERSSMGARTASPVDLSLKSDGYEFLLAVGEEDEEDEEEEEIVFNRVGSKSSKQSRAEYSLLIVLIVMLSVGYPVEGAIGDWSAVYLAEDCRVPPSSGWNVLGYAFFNMFVVVSRIVSDIYVRDLGRGAILMFSSGLSCLGFFLIAVAPMTLTNGEGSYIYPLLLAVMGFSVTGLALGPISAVVLSACGSIPGIDPSWAVSVTCGFSYVGLLIGPIILGMVAEYSSLSWSFVVAAALVLSVSPLARLLEKASADAGQLDS